MTHSINIETVSNESIKTVDGSRLEANFESILGCFEIAIDYEYTTHQNLECECAVYITKNNLDCWSKLYFGNDALQKGIEYINKVLVKFN